MRKPKHYFLLSAAPMFTLWFNNFFAQREVNEKRMSKPKHYFLLSAALSYPLCEHLVFSV